MQHKALISFNVAMFLLFALFIGTIQTTIWYQLFGNTPSPILWISLITYLSLYRKPAEGIVTVYLVSFMLINFTSMPLGVFLLCLLFIFSTIQLIKDRVYVSGPSYFLLVTSISAIGFHLCEILLTWLLQDSFRLQILTRLTEILLTPLSTIPIYFCLHWIDQITHRDSLLEPGSPPL